MNQHRLSPLSWLLISGGAATVAIIVLQMFMEAMLSLY